MCSDFMEYMDMLFLNTWFVDTKVLMAECAGMCVITMQV